MNLLQLAPLLLSFRCRDGSGLLRSEAGQDKENVIYEWI